MTPYTIIGIDPGSLRTGWGIVAETSGVLSLVDCGIIRVPARRQGLEVKFSIRLAHIYQELCSIIAGHLPDAAAIENVFTAQNAASALKLGQARGAAVCACASYSLNIFDYEPTLVKKSLVGNGRAEKEQVAFMTARILNLHQPNLPLDTTDALAVAICHLSQRRFLELAKKTATSGTA